MLDTGTHQLLAILMLEQLAVKRFVKYWDKRVKAFGPKKAFQPLTQDGALRDDSSALENGFIRLTPTKGAGGRSIFFCDPALQDFQYSRESMVRAIWYLFHVALECEDTQQRGMVFIVYPYNASLSKLDRKLMENICASVQGCIPRTYYYGEDPRCQGCSSPELPSNSLVFVCVCLQFALVACTFADHLLR